MRVRILPGVAMLLTGIAFAQAQEQGGSTIEPQVPQRPSPSEASDDADERNRATGENQDESGSQTDEAQRQQSDRSQDSDDSSSANRDRDRSDRSQQDDRSGRQRETGSRREGERNDRMNRRTDRDDYENRDRESRRDREDEDRTFDNRRRFSADRDQDRDDSGNWQDQYGFSLTRARQGGLQVSDVRQRGLAGRVGLRSGDVILSIDGDRVASAAQFNRLVRDSRGNRPAIVVWRDGQQRTLYWDGARTQNWQEDRQWQDEDYGSSSNVEAFLGVVFDTRYEDAAVVRQVYGNSPAQRAGVRAGNAILSINGEVVRSPEDVTELISDMDPGSRIELQISQSPPRTIDVRLGARGQQGYAAYRGENLNDMDDDDTERFDDDLSNDRADRGLFGRSRSGFFDRD